MQFLVQESGVPHGGIARSYILTFLRTRQEIERAERAQRVLLRAIRTLEKAGAGGGPLVMECGWPTMIGQLHARRQEIETHLSIKQAAMRGLTRTRETRPVPPIESVH